jgi:hypothetical protein
MITSKLLFLGSLSLTLGLALPADAAPTVVKRTVRPVAAPRGKEAGARAVGIHVVPHPGQPVHATNNPPHTVIIHNTITNKDENHVVVVDHRPGHVVDHDPHLRVIHRGYRSPHNWAHFHVARGGWWHLWGINNWDNVGTVTCEAANEQTGELFPVSEDRDERAWDDDTVNSILDQALDDCFAEANGAQCSPATPSCSFQPQ